MTDLLTLIAEAEELDGQCPHCGTRTSSRSPIHAVNHSAWGDTCTSRYLSRYHAREALRKVNPDTRDDTDRCIEHCSQSKPCPQAHFDKDYAMCAAMANRVWGPNGWKETPKQVQP